MEDDDRCDLIARLFAVMTADLEDGAALAADGQGRDAARERRLALAGQIHAIAQRVTLVADAVVVLLEAGPNAAA